METAIPLVAQDEPVVLVQQDEAVVHDRDRLDEQALGPLPGPLQRRHGRPLRRHLAGDGEDTAVRVGPRRPLHTAVAARLVAIAVPQPPRTGPPAPPYGPLP